MGKPKKVKLKKEEYNKEHNPRPVIKSYKDDNKPHPDMSLPTSPGHDGKREGGK